MPIKRAGALDREPDAGVGKIENQDGKQEMLAFAP